MIPLISIIVPVYNVKEYLDDCVTSILNQTYQNIEIILVDDGSTDGSHNLVDELSKKDNRIKVIHQKNQGVSSARNVALGNATGKYICFVDADDMVSEIYVSTLYELISDVEVDLSILSTYKDSKTRQRIFYMSAADAINAMFDMSSGIKTGPYCKLFKHSIIEQENIRFPVGIKCGEDMLFCYQYMVKAKRISYLQCNRSEFYHYRYRNDGVYGHKQYDVELSHKKAYDILIENNDGVLNIDSIKEINQRRAHMSLHLLLYYWSEKHKFNDDLRIETLKNTKLLYPLLNGMDKCIYWMLKCIPHIFYVMYLLVFHKIGSRILYRSNMKKVFDENE